MCTLKNSKLTHILFNLKNDPSKPQFLGNGKFLNHLEGNPFKYISLRSFFSDLLLEYKKIYTMADPAVQFVRVCYGEDYRIVTFYQDQPVHELRELLGALFPGTTSAHGRRPIAIERLVDRQVVPLSSATKFPQVMSHGNWELLVTRPNTLRTEKLVIAGFLQDMLAHGFVTPGE